MTTRRTASTPGRRPYTPEDVLADIAIINAEKAKGTYTQSAMSPEAAAATRRVQNFTKGKAQTIPVASPPGSTAAPSEQERTASSGGTAPSGTSSTSASEEPANVTDAKNRMRAIQENKNKNFQTEQAQADGVLIENYEREQRAKARAEAQAAERAGTPPTVSGGTAGTGAVASTPTPAAEAAEESNGGQGPSSNEQITRIASNVDTAARQGGPRSPSSEAAVQDARNTIRRSEAGGPVTPEELESARRTVAEKEQYDQALRDEAEAERLGAVVGSSVGANARGTAGDARPTASTPDPAAEAAEAAQMRVQERRDRDERQAAEAAGTAVASTGGTAKGTTATQGTVAPSTVAPYAVDSKEYDADWAIVEEFLERDRQELPITPAERTASDAANDRIEKAHLARLAAAREAAVQARTEGASAAGDGAVSSVAAPGEFDLTPIGDLGESPTGFGRIEAPNFAAPGQPSLQMLGLKSPAYQEEVVNEIMEKGRAAAEAQARRTNMYGMEGVAEMVAAERKKEADAIKLQQLQAAENAKREAAAAGNKANWFEANRRINSTGFSGCDINALVRVPKRGKDGFNEERVFNIGTLQTISISTYNSKTPVRALGFKNPVAIARGGRTIAGTMIFNQLHTHVLDESDYGSLTSVLDKNGLLSYSSGVDVTIYSASDVNTSGVLTAEKNRNRKKVWDFSWDTTMNKGRFQKPSDIIPFDIVIWMINESGGMGKIILYDVDIIHDSTTLSVEDIYTEVQYQYMARDVEYFQAYNIDQAYEWQGVTLPSVVTLAEIKADIMDPTAENFQESY